MAILGILSAVVIPSANPTLRDQLVATAEMVASDLAYGRSLAVANNSRYRFRFNVTSNSYLLEHAGANAALDVLPRQPFADPGDSARQYVVRLAELPHVGPAVALAAVGNVSATTVTRATELEFDALGATTASAERTAIWLSAGTGSGRRYLPLFVEQATGLTTVGTFTGAAPPASAQ